MLVSRDDVKVNTKDEAGRSPLYYTVEEGHEPVVKLLVTWDDVEVDSKDNQARSPLFNATAGKGHEVVVKILVARDDVEVDSKRGGFQGPKSPGLSQAQPEPSRQWGLRLGPVIYWAGASSSWA